MTNIEALRSGIAERFQNVQEVRDGVLKGELTHDGKPYAVAYWDLSDCIMERSANLTRFQEDLLGPEFFSPEGDLRWNSYLYFLAGPASISKEGYPQAKRRIESDRHFARKFVLDADGLLERLQAAKPTGQASKLVDAGEVWAAMLMKGELGYLLEQPARKTALKRISDGSAFRTEHVKSVTRSPASVDSLSKGPLRRLSISSFRRVYLRDTFQFADVNLIVGSNGVGKTSLLEAIEAFYCSRVRRDPDTPVVNLVGYIESPEGRLQPVRATSDVAMLKSRNTAWYGRSDYQSNAISKGFSRFNFLDTDAASRLSATDDPSQIKTDLGRLLVGSETAELWDYLRKLSEDLRPRLREANERLPSMEKNVELLGREVERLKTAPSVANMLVSAYEVALQELGPRWQRPDEVGVLFENEGKILQELAHSAALVLSLKPKSPATQASVQARSSELQQMLQQSDAQRQLHSISSKRFSDATQQLFDVSRELDFLDLWHRMLEADIPRLTSGLKSTQQRRSAIERRLGWWMSGEGVVGSEYLRVHVRVALASVERKLAIASDEEEKAGVALAHSLALGQSLGDLRRDLHDTSISIIEKSGDPNHCPVCRTEHDASELRSKLGLLLSAKLGEISDGLRGGVQQARERVEEIRHELRCLQFLSAFSVDVESATCEQVLQDIEALRTEHSQLQVESNRIRMELTGARESGLEWREADTTLSRVQSLFQEPSMALDLRAVAERIAALRRAKDDHLAVIQREEARASTLEQEADVLIETVLGVQTARVPYVHKFEVLERAAHEAGEAARRFSMLTRHLELASTESAELLQARLQACFLAFEKARQAVAGERTIRTSFEQKQVDLTKVKELLESKRTERDNLLRANEVLGRLVSHASLEKLTGDAFASIKDRVSAAFAQIHAPQEYELGEFSEGELVKRRDDKSVQGVHQVSTGQRAALALSIFLALNETATAAPPVILIDDPVAHVDDLNALSFLDYLRDIALRGRKQIFFATADLRLAALFQRKFEFLGPGHFKKIVLPRIKPAVAEDSRSS